MVLDYGLACANTQRHTVCCMQKAGLAQVGTSGGEVDWVPAIRSGRHQSIGHEDAGLLSLAAGMLVLPGTEVTML